ncbi:MAG: TetR/AcrR family transcriptional regulator, partial [Tissierellia bacterium]|nr:TetR/AcrR family transcriptional regulator [Tissierellia bacterium]
MMMVGRDKEKYFEKREELINIAMKEFGEKGYENASLNNILKETGISKGTFYYHYKNKEDLYMHLLDIITEEKLKFINKEMATEESAQSIFDKFKLLVKAGMKFAHTHPVIDKFAQSYIKEIGSKAYEERMNKYFASRKEFLGDLLKKY